MMFIREKMSISDVEIEYTAEVNPHGELEQADIIKVTSINGQRHADATYQAIQTVITKLDQSWENLIGAMRS